VERVLSFVGLFGLVALAWLMSTDRRAVKWRPVVWGIALQLGLAVVILVPDAGQALFQGVDVGVRRLLSFSEAGSDFVFQTIEPHEITVIHEGARETATYIGRISPPVKTLAFWILPTVVFFSALMALLYHYGLMQWLVALFGRVMQRTMGTSGAESLSAAANIFVGQTEAPLVVRPFVEHMTRSELNAVMVGGFATIAGGVMAIYVGVLGHIPGIAGHLVTASLMSAPAALAIAKLMVPETEIPRTMGKTDLRLERLDVNGIDALARGTLEGLQLALNIGAMLLVFVAVIAMVNAILGFFRLAGRADADAPGRVRLGVLAAGAADGHPVVRGAHGGHAAGREARADGADRLPAPGRAAGHGAGAEPEVGDHHVVCAVWLRELREYRHPARGHRRHGPVASPRPGAARPARDDRRHAGRDDDGRRGRDHVQRLTGGARVRAPRAR
jgi:nucleoside transporter